MSSAIVCDGCDRFFLCESRDELADLGWVTHKNYGETVPHDLCPKCVDREVDRTAQEAQDQLDRERR